MKRFRTIIMLALSAATALALLAGPFALAGEGDKPEMTPAQMKEMFSKCAMCKIMVPHVDKAWFNTWSMEVYNLKDGMVMVEHVGDKSGMADYKTVFASFEKTGKEVEKWSEAEAKKQLCEHCQSMHSLIKAGAKHDWVLTKDGCVGVIISDKPETVKMIHAQADQMRQMFVKE